MDIAKKDKEPNRLHTNKPKRKCHQHRSNNKFGLPQRSPTT